ncbi:MAG: LysR substrate-binding domain-containing protein [Pusillimonas sp.]
MELKQLRAFITVVETRNVTKAAALLNIVQPAVSRQLHQLEADVGTALFTRGRRAMELTEAGKVLENYARRVLNEIERARAEIRPSRGEVGGIVTVGLLPSTSDVLSSALVRAVKERYPGILLRLTPGYAGHLAGWLEAGDIDVALLYENKSAPSIKTRPLVEESLWLIGPPDSGLDQAIEVRFTDVLARPLILPSAPHGLRTLVEHAAQSHGRTLNIQVETNSMSVQKRLVLDGHGYTVLPSIAVVEDLSQGILAAAPVIDPVLKRRIVLGVSTARPQSNAVHCVVTELIECVKEALNAKAWPAARWLVD